MKKILCILLATVMTLGCLSFAGSFPGNIQAQAKTFETQSGVEVTIEPFLYKSTAHPMKFPSHQGYEIKEESDPGDYAISRELNDLGYVFVFPAGTTDISANVSLDGETNWRGFHIDHIKTPSYWRPDENGVIDYTKPVTFTRREETAEQDEYGILYRDYLRGAGVEGFRDYDKIYWRLTYIRNGETFVDYFDVKLYDYDMAEKYTLKALNYNVAGLPSFGRIIGMPGANVPDNQRVIAEYINKNGFDIVAVQEDFGYHKNLAQNLNGYNHATNHLGGIPGGDGLNVFTKSMTIYNETRVPWEVACGVLAHGADELTPKGFVYSVIDIGNGIYVDFYNLHADAYGGEGSIAARTTQLRQLADFINARCAENDRPVIVTGDFNNYMHTHEDDGALYNTLFLECGLKDAWVECKNGGDYFNFYNWHISGDRPWGNWDSVERFMYKGGGGVQIQISDFRFVNVLNENGVEVSDHAAAECDFTFIKTSDFAENTQKLEVVPATENLFLRRIKWIFRDLILVFSHLNELPELLNEG